MRITKDNIHLFIYGTTMDCIDKDITYIEFIPDCIKYLYCYNNKLTELPNLPDRLRYLNCSNSQLTKLPKLPEGLMFINCSNNNLPYPITIENLKEHNTLLKRKEILSKICV